jgi:hypothetical protein
VRLDLHIESAEIESSSKARCVPRSVPGPVFREQATVLDCRAPVSHIAPSSEGPYCYLANSIVIREIFTVISNRVESGPVF